MIDELLDRDDDNQYFRSVYAKYWNQNAQTIAMAIEFLYDSLSLGFMEEEFRSMLREIYQIQAHLGSDMTFVEYLVKWGELAYKGHCLLDECGDKFSTFSENMTLAWTIFNDNSKERLTLKWITMMTNILYDELMDDLIINNTYFS